MIRKVRFPLKYKFVVIITTLLLLTMGFYLSYAVNIFKEDKAADVYSITLSNSISVAERIKLLINEDINLIEGLKEVIDTNVIQKKMNSIITNRDEILGIECLINNQNYLSQKNDKKLEQLLNNVDTSAILLNEESGSLKAMKQILFGESRLTMSSVKSFPPHYSLIRGIDNNLKCAIHISYEKLMPLMNETINYGTYLLTENGKLFFKLNNIAGSSNLSDIAKDSNIRNVQQGVKRFNSEGVAIIRAFAKIPNLGLIAITEIEENKAFLASNQLIYKSLYFGILILSVAVIAGILFTKRMTKNVQTLFEATTLLSEGNFDVHPIAKGSDEIGALTDSFVDMKDKIIKFMEEMKEKARIEGELQVAHLVQNSFFPKSAVNKATFSFDGKYQPASECSGDWWGYFEQDKKVTIVVCDATGHGVPAALITAAAHSCISTLKIESEQKYISPNVVLSSLNKVICLMNSEILMTSFALEIDEENSVITYSNASHMTPFLIRKDNDVYSKDGVNPLQENNGARLGEKFDSIYLENKMNIVSGDRIVLYSDGLTEMIVEGKAWGQRNFLKSLFFACEKEDATSFVLSVMKDFSDYTKGTALLDDITLVGISFGEKKAIIDNVESFKRNKEEIEKAPFAISHLCNSDNVTEVLNESHINHLIGHNSISLERERLLVKKIESRNEFNLMDYLSNDYVVKKWDLINNKKIVEAVDEMKAQLDGTIEAGINLDVLRLVSEELLSNAFYHSNGDGSKLARGQEIILTPDKVVEYLVATGEEYVIVSVKGPSGFSSREKIIDCIKRGYEEKAPLEGDAGAGLGLYMIYENCNQFWVINGTPHSGQIVCVFEKFNRYKKAKERITSFHFISKEISS